MRWVPISTNSSRFRRALFSSRTVGFPESGWRRQLLSPRNLPVWSKVQALACIRSTTIRLYPRLDISQSCTVPRHCVRQCCHTDAYCPPRAPLHDYGVTAFAPRSWHWSARVTPPSSLILAHAPDHHTPVGFGRPYSSRSLQVAASPCCMTALPDVISAILVWALESVPRRDCSVLLSDSSRAASASP